jgi:hypothetical protein
MLANLVYFNANGIPFKANYPDAINQKLHYVDYMVNDFDLVVDKNNFAHVFMSLVISGFGDTLNATFPNGITYNPGYGSWNMHMYFTDLQSPVKGEIINRNSGLNGCWGDCNGSDNFIEANRPQVSRSEDGSHVVFAWYDTDKIAHPQVDDTTNNGNPDLWIQKLRVADSGVFYYGSQPRNITKGSDYDGLAALGNVAPRLLNKPGGGYYLASTISAFEAYNPATGTGQMTTQHLYVNNVGIPAVADSSQIPVLGALMNANSSVLATVFTSQVQPSDSGAISGGNVIYEGGSNVIERGVCWNTSPEPTVDLTTKTINGEGTGPYASQISGLNPQTMYYLRAYATNSAGTAYGPQQIFTTLPTVSASPALTNAVLLFPNPGSGYLFFKGLGSGGELVLLSPEGKEMLRKKLSEEGRLDVSFLNPSVYFYRIQTASEIYRGKLVLNK